MNRDSIVNELLVSKMNRDGMLTNCGLAILSPELGQVWKVGTRPGSNSLVEWNKNNITRTIWCVERPRSFPIAGADARYGKADRGHSTHPTVPTHVAYRRDIDLGPQALCIVF